MKHATSPPWHAEAGREGTPDEFVDWFLSNDRAGQIEIAEWSLRFASESNACLIRNCMARVTPPGAAAGGEGK